MLLIVVPEMPLAFVALLLSTFGAQGQSEDGPKVAIVSTEYATDLQDQFEVLPGVGDTDPAWLGADSDVSVLIGGGTTRQRALWIFADTYISGYNRSADQRVWKGMRMPHNTIGLVDCKGVGSCKGGKVQYHWRQDENKRAVSFFQLPEGDGAGKPLLWPVAGLASRDGKSVVLLAQRVLGGLNVVGTTSIVVKNVDKLDPLKDWNYSTADQQAQVCPSCKSATLNFFSTITWANPTEPSDSTVYLFGHDTNCKRLLADCTLLARTDFNKLLKHDWSGVEFWTTKGWSSAAYSTSSMKALNVPSWETTMQWEPSLQLWYTFDRGGGGNISLWTATEPTTTWQKTFVYSIPGPFNGPHPQGSWLCYAAKSHPELGGYTATGTTVELIFSYVCNTWGGGSNRTIVQEFQPGGMSLKPTANAPTGIRGYWFRFIRAKVTSAQSESIVV